MVGVGDDLAGGLRAEPVNLVGGPVEAGAQEHRDREQERDHAPASPRPPNTNPNPVTASLSRLSGSSQVPQ
jgi:hypothetical protein